MQEGMREVSASGFSMAAAPAIMGLASRTASKVKDWGEGMLNTEDEDEDGGEDGAAQGVGGAGLGSGGSGSLLLATGRLGLHHVLALVERMDGCKTHDHC